MMDGEVGELSARARGLLVYGLVTRISKFHELLFIKLSILY